MKFSLCAIVLTLLVSTSVSAEGTESSALRVVNNRMAAYNQHDLTHFLATYADDIRVYTYPDKLLTNGKDGLRSIFSSMFDEAQVQVTIHHQIVKDSYVINQETVRYQNGPIDYVSIYKVVGGLITEVRFVRD